MYKHSSVAIAENKFTKCTEMNMIQGFMQMFKLKQRGMFNQMCEFRTHKKVNIY